MAGALFAIGREQGRVAIAISFQNSGEGLNLTHFRSGPELTLRGIVLGALMTVIFTAANVYLGLKVGLTFGSAIPAAVISMALLSVFSDANIRENNIVQTIASAAGALASIIFVLPGLVIVGWWTGFPFWLSFMIAASGGMLGVLFTIPLRRALVTNSDLPYPEGVAGAEVLKVGSARREGGNPAEAREGLNAVMLGAVASAGLTVLAATRLATESIAQFFRIGAGASGYQFSYSLALIAAGHLVGLSVGMAMLLGVAIAWIFAVPMLTSATGIEGDVQAFTMGIWSTQVRFIGAGAIGVAALWTLGQLAHRITMGLIYTFSNWKTPITDDVPETDRDMSGRSIVILGVIALLAIGFITWEFTRGTPLAPHAITMVFIAVPFALVGGFIIAVICGYMAGLIGSSNSPISGVGILAITASSLILLGVMATTVETTGPALTAMALFITAICFAAATSSNDNLQDLKTGQLVGATPWRQQLALMIGVLAASAVVPLVLNLLAQAYGFAGALNLDTVTDMPLPAPQANLIAALARGVIEGDANWRMIAIGAGIGVIAVIIDEGLRVTGKMRLPPLAIGMGIYLPMALTLPVALGSVIGWSYNRAIRKSSDPERSQRLGVLVASGMIVGESLFGVLNAGLIVALNRDAPLALAPAGFPAAEFIGPVFFFLALIALYRWMLARARLASTE
ncbi:MAG: hypothetical protein RJB62_9 [Pseudomonadota bacterium]